MFRAPLRRLAPALTIVACLLSAPPALAASATVDYGQDRLEYTAATGERNSLTLTGSSGTYTIEDTISNISAGSGCTQLAAKRVRCSSSQIDSVQLDLRDQDDVLVNSAAIDVEVTAGDGGDKVTGGSSGDKLYGGAGDDVLDGGFGSDLLDGNDGRDSVTYASRTAPLNVNLGTFWGGDGQFGEWDFISSSVEDVVGGSGDDSITGTSAPNTFVGGAGNDTLDGREGNDVLEGGAGTDRLDAGSGDDTLLSRDSGPDTVDCGAGTDGIDVDAADTVAADCERPASGPGGTTVLPGAATLDRVPSSVRLTRTGYLRIKVTCPVTAVNGCSGTITVALLARAKGVSLSAARRSAGRRFSLKAGQTKVTKVKISRNGRRRVLKRKRANCKVSVHTKSAGTVSKKITVKAPKQSKKRRSR